MGLPFVYFAFVCFLFLDFPPPESLPGDDVLRRLLSRPLPSVFFFPYSFMFGLLGHIGTWTVIWSKGFGICYIYDWDTRSSILI